MTRRQTSVAIIFHPSSRSGPTTRGLRLVGRLEEHELVRPARRPVVDAVLVEPRAGIARLPARVIPPGPDLGPELDDHAPGRRPNGVDGVDDVADAVRLDLPPEGRDPGQVPDASSPWPCPSARLRRTGRAASPGSRRPPGRRCRRCPSRVSTARRSVRLLSSNHAAPGWSEDQVDHDLARRPGHPPHLLRRSRRPRSAG